MVTVGFIGAPYFAREDEGLIIFTVGVTSGHTLDRDIEVSFSTADSTQAGNITYKPIYVYQSINYRDYFVIFLLYNFRNGYC